MTNVKWKITTLMDNYAAKSDYITGQHGLSLFIEKFEKNNSWSILLDAGREPEVLLRNAQHLGINWSSLKAIVLSHGHYDHTGGLLDLLRSLKKPVPIICHPEAFSVRVNSQPYIRSIGAPFSEEDIKELKFPVIHSKSEVPISNDLIVTGEIPRINKLEEESIKNFYREKDGCYIKDVVIDDKSIIILLPGRGFFLICGCCHSGLLNTISYAMNICTEKRLVGVMGGFHMIGSSDERMNMTIEKLKEYDPQFIIPMHCTGQKESAILYSAFKEKVVFLGAGSVFEI